MEHNYVFSAIEMTTCIITKATDIELIEALELEIYKKDTWENSAQYILSSLPSFSPFGREVHDKFVVISPPIKGWRILSSRKFGSFETAVEIARTLSKKFEEAFVYYSDMHCGYKSFSICKNGYVENIINNNDTKIEILGNLIHLKNKVNHNQDNIESLMDANVLNIDEIVCQIHTHSSLESHVCLLKQHYSEFKVSRMSKHFIEETLNCYHPICSFFGVSQYDWNSDDNLPF